MPRPAFEREGIEAEFDRVRSLGVSQDALLTAIAKARDGSTISGSAALPPSPGLPSGKQ
jgi:hypothetical protein